LTNPQALVPGTKMYFLLADPQSRADIIAYLVQQK
jgi:cytochrome c2